MIFLWKQLKIVLKIDAKNISIDRNGNSRLGETAHTSTVNSSIPTKQYYTIEKNKSNIILYTKAVSKNKTERTITMHSSSL